MWDSLRSPSVKLSSMCKRDIDRFISDVKLRSLCGNTCQAHILRCTSVVRYMHGFWMVKWMVKWIKMGELAHLREQVSHGGLVIPTGPAWGLGTSGLTCANARAHACPPPSACLCTMSSCSGVAVLAATATRASSMVFLPSPWPKTADGAARDKVALRQVWMHVTLQFLVAHCIFLPIYL